MNTLTRTALLTRLEAHPLFDPTASDAPSLWFTHAPDEAAPPVVLLTLTSDRRIHSHSGPVGLAEADLSVDVWAADMQAALALREAAITQLDNYAEAPLTHCLHEGSEEDYDAEANMAHAQASFSLGYKTA